MLLSNNIVRFYQTISFFLQTFRQFVRDFVSKSPGFSERPLQPAINRFPQFAVFGAFFAEKQLAGGHQFQVIAEGVGKRRT